jgi:hypothetical protein
MAQCITCGTELHPERAQKYNYCMAPKCQEKNAKGLTMVAVGMNKAADELVLLDERTREALANGKYQDQRRGSFGPPAPSRAPAAPDTAAAVSVSPAAGTAPSAAPADTPARAAATAPGAAPADTPARTAQTAPGAAPADTPARTAQTAPGAAPADAPARTAAAAPGAAPTDTPARAAERAARRRRPRPSRPAPASATRPRWTASQERLALLYNQQGLRPDEIADKLGVSTYLATQIVLAARSHRKA